MVGRQAPGRVDKGVDFLLAGAVVEDGGADGEISVDHRGRRRGDAGFLDRDGESGVELVRIVGPIAEADDIELGGREKLEARLGLDAGFEMPRDRAAPLDHPADALGTVGLQGEPGLERPEAARQIRSEIAGPGRTGGEPPRLPAQIGGRRRESIEMLAGIPDQQEPRVIGNLGPFMEVEGDRIRRFDAA